MVSKTQSRKTTKVARAVSKVVGSYQKDKDMLIQILLDLQGMFGWLSRDVLIEVSEQLEVPISQVYRIASYYKIFSLTPRGRHIIKVCLGTACQVRGSQKLLNTISAMLDVKPCQTSQDMRFTLETVKCVGCCATGPVVEIDGTHHEKPSPSTLRKILKSAK
jgi:NADH-quinone oxidoreductase subunit E